MQDYPKLLLKTKQDQQQHDHSTINTTCLVATFPRFMAWSPVKNDYARAKLLFEKTGFEESPRSGEADIQELHRQQLLSVNSCPSCNPEGKTRIEIEEGAHICLWPEAGVTTEELHRHIGENVVIRKGSVLIIRCRNWFLDSVIIDGCCILGDEDLCNKNAIRGSIVLRNVQIQNKGWHYDPIDPMDPKVGIIYRMRGYVVRREEQFSVTLKTAECYVIENKDFNGIVNLDL